jgi:hypothetical protein
LKAPAKLIFVYGKQRQKGWGSAYVSSWIKLQARPATLWPTIGSKPPYGHLVHRADFLADVTAKNMVSDKRA